MRRARRTVASMLIAAGAFAATFLPQAAAAQEWRETRPNLFWPTPWSAQVEVALRSGGGLLVARCQAGAYTVRWEPGFTFDRLVSQPIRIVWPDAAAESQLWQLDLPHALVAAAPQQLSRRIMGGQAPVLELADERERIRRVTVPTRNAVGLITPVMEACNQNPTDFEVARPDIDPRTVALVDGLDDIEGYFLRLSLLGERRLDSRSARPIELYEAVDRLRDELVPAMCLDRASGTWELPMCAAFRSAREADPAAGMPAPPAEVLEAYLTHCCVEEREQQRQREAQLAVVRECGQTDAPARPLRPFRVERAYPEAALAAGQQGVLRAKLLVDQAGRVVDVRILAAHPAGIFEEAVEREFRAMAFVPAKSNCQPAMGEYRAMVAFVMSL